MGAGGVYVLVGGLLGAGLGAILGVGYELIWGAFEPSDPDPRHAGVSRPL